MCFVYPSTNSNSLTFCSIVFFFPPSTFRFLSSIDFSYPLISVSLYLVYPSTSSNYLLFCSIRLLSLRSPSSLPSNPISLPSLILLRRVRPPARPPVPALHTSLWREVDGRTAWLALSSRPPLRHDNQRHWWKELAAILPSSPAARPPLCLVEMVLNERAIAGLRNALRFCIKLS